MLVTDKIASNELTIRARREPNEDHKNNLELHFMHLRLGCSLVTEREAASGEAGELLTCHLFVLPQHSRVAKVDV